jgi:nitrate reductase gamma subunit
MLTAPLGYLTRPYIVYRSRDVGLGARAPRRGWERVG